MARIEKDEATGCWNWQGHVSDNGYGYMSSSGRGTKVGVHRASYTAFVGPIPAGLAIDHLCRNRVCVNPDHLEPVTQAENNRRSVAARAPRDETCRRGHVRTPDNTETDTATGWPRCTDCIRESNRKGAKGMPQVRIPLASYRALAEQAEAQGISITHLVQNVIENHLTFTPPEATPVLHVSPPAT